MKKTIRDQDVILRGKAWEFPPLTVFSIPLVSWECCCWGSLLFSN